MDSYAQALRVLFYKAYPSAQRGSAEAEDMGKAVLSSQFVSGLLPEIKSKVAGSEGDFHVILLAKAWLEEAKLRDLMLSQNKVFHVRRLNLGHSASCPPEKMITSEQQPVSAGT